MKEEGIRSTMDLALPLGNFYGKVENYLQFKEIQSQIILT